MSRLTSCEVRDRVFRCLCVDVDGITASASSSANPASEECSVGGVDDGSDAMTCTSDVICGWGVDWRSEVKGCTELLASKAASGALGGSIASGTLVNRAESELWDGLGGDGLCLFAFNALSVEDERSASSDFRFFVAVVDEAAAGTGLALLMCRGVPSASGANSSSSSSSRCTSYSDGS